MNYDNPKLPLKPQFVIERSLNGPAQGKNDSNNLPTGPLGLPDLGGYPSITLQGTTGTVASGASLSTVPSYTINFMPREGAIPSYEMELQHLGRVSEQIVNPTEKKTSA